MDDGREVFKEIKRLAKKIANSGGIILIDDKGKRIYEYFLGDKKQSMVRVEAYISPKVDIRLLLNSYDIGIN